MDFDRSGRPEFREQVRSLDDIVRIIQETDDAFIELNNYITELENKFYELKDYTNMLEDLLDENSIGYEYRNINI